MQFTNLFLEKVKVRPTSFLSSVVARQALKVFEAFGRLFFVDYEHLAELEILFRTLVRRLFCNIPTLA